MSNWVNYLSLQRRRASPVVVLSTIPALALLSSVKFTPIEPTKWMARLINYALDYVKGTQKGYFFFHRSVKVVNYPKL